MLAVETGGCCRTLHPDVVAVFPASDDAGLLRVRDSALLGRPSCYDDYYYYYYDSDCYDSDCEYGYSSGTDPDSCVFDCRDYLSSSSYQQCSCYGGSGYYSDSDSDFDCYFDCDFDDPRSENHWNDQNHPPPRPRDGPVPRSWKTKHGGIVYSTAPGCHHHRGTVVWVALLGAVPVAPLPGSILQDARVFRCAGDTVSDAAAVAAVAAGWCSV